MESGSSGNQPRHPGLDLCLSSTLTPSGQDPCWQLGPFSFQKSCDTIVPNVTSTCASERDSPLDWSHFCSRD